MMQHLNTFLEILNEPPSFDDDNDSSSTNTSTNSDENACEGLLKEFTDDEKIEIANVSYAFWIVNLKVNERLPIDGQRNSALKEIRRHYVGENRDHTKTLSALKEAMAYRRQYHANILRSCCYEHYKYDCDDGEAAELAKKYRSFVIKDLERQPMVVRGIDDNSRTIVYKSPRMSSSSSEGKDNAIDADEAFLMTQIYTAEKAMATNEFELKSKEERLTVVFNFRDYSRKNSPSMYTIKTLAQVLQRCYPERLGVLIIVDPPFWIRSAFNIVWPLLSTATTEKIKLPSGQAAIDEAFHEVVGGNEKLAGMLANGDISSIDLIDYTKQPFYCQFE
jgi:hypothetical protein